MGMNAEDSGQGPKPASFESLEEVYILEGTSMLEEGVVQEARTDRMVARRRLVSQLRHLFTCIVHPACSNCGDDFAYVYGMCVSCVSCVLASFEGSMASRAMDLL